MQRSNFDARFFESTRGRILLLLRHTLKTVNELAAELGLTDNAVRAHLLSLERDKLVETAGIIKGFRKPHSTYRLTDEARHLFPKPYDSLFNMLIEVMEGWYGTGELEEALRETGRRLANVNGPRPGDLDKDLEHSVRTLEELGGAARIERADDRISIKSESCPFADAVTEHPEVCKIAESMISEMVGRGVTETCDRTARPKCCFQIAKA